MKLLKKIISIATILISIFITCSCSNMSFTMERDTSESETKEESKEISAAEKAHEFFGSLTNEKSYKHIDDEAYKYLDSDQIDVYNLTEKIYEAIINVKIDDLSSYLDMQLDESLHDTINYYISDNSKNNKLVKSLAKKLDYKVNEMYRSGDKIYASIEFTYPSILKLANKVMPSILLKNAVSFMKGKIDENTIESIFETIVKEIETDNIEPEKYNYEFAFRKVYGEWKLTDIDVIYEKLEKYFADLIS